MPPRITHVHITLMWHMRVGVGQVARTQVRRKTLDPVYNEAFLMEYSMEATTIHLTVFDWDPPDTEQEIGRLTIAIDKMQEDVTMCQARLPRVWG